MLTEETCSRYYFVDVVIVAKNWREISFQEYILKKSENSLKKEIELLNEFRCVEYGKVSL